MSESAGATAGEAVGIILILCIMGVLGFLVWKKMFNGQDEGWYLQYIFNT